MIDALVLFTLLLLWHGYADLAWQFPGKHSDWRMLALHGAAHGVGVGVIAMNPLLGLAEGAAHCAIDYAKGRRWLGTVSDQTLHVLCKAMWVALALKEI